MAFQKRTYFINGWVYSKSYFMSFGFSRKEIEEMEAGKDVRRIDSCSDNIFSIEVEEI